MFLFVVCTSLSQVISRLENVLVNIDDSESWRRIKITPLSLSSSSKLLKTLNPIKFDTIWTGLSVSHYIDHSFSQIVENQGRVGNGNFLSVSELKSRPKSTPIQGPISIQGRFT